MSAPTSTGSGGGVGETADAAKQSGQAVAGSAADHARDLAGTASEKASDVLGEAKSQASDLLGNTREQVRTEAENRRGQAVSSLRAIGDELDSMQSHDGDKGIATQLASRGGEYVRQTADWLDGREPSQILDDVRRFARERPGTFLLGALLAGVVAGRFTRAVKAGAPSGGSSSGGSSSGGSSYSDPTYSGTPAALPASGGTTARHEQVVPTAAPFASSQGGPEVGGAVAPAGYDVDADGYPHVGDDLANRPGTL